jgi:hypothetical protein
MSGIRLLPRAALPGLMEEHAIVAIHPRPRALVRVGRKPAQVCRATASTSGAPLVATARIAALRTSFPAASSLSVSVTKMSASSRSWALALRACRRGHRRYEDVRRRGRRSRVTPPIEDAAGACHGRCRRVTGRDSQRNSAPINAFPVASCEPSPWRPS